MRYFRLLLIASIFLLHSAAVMASSVKICCMDAHCPVAECVAMGCIAQPLPPAAVPVALHFFRLAGVHAGHAIGVGAAGVARGRHMDAARLT